MRDDLVPPAFADGQLEIFWRGGQLSIDATYEGLVRLLEILNSLREQVERTKRNEHIHLEDYEILTSKSPPCVIGVFVDAEGIIQAAGVSSQGVSPRSGFWQTLKKRLFCGRL